MLLQASQGPHLSFSSAFQDLLFAFQVLNHWLKLSVLNGWWHNILFLNMVLKYPNLKKKARDYILDTEADWQTEEL